MPAIFIRRISLTKIVSKIRPADFQEALIVLRSAIFCSVSAINLHKNNESCQRHALYQSLTLWDHEFKTPSQHLCISYCSTRAIVKMSVSQWTAASRIHTALTEMTHGQDRHATPHKKSHVCAVKSLVSRLLYTDVTADYDKTWRLTAAREQW